MDQALVSRQAAFRSGAARLRQQAEYESASVARLRDKVRRIEEEKADLQKALALIDRCIELVSANGIGKIESIVTAGLQQVFKDDKRGPIAFVVEKKDGARGSSYRMLVKRQGGSTGSLMATSGGVQNVAAFLLRVIMCKRFKLGKLIVLDESLNNINGRQNQARMSQMLKTLASDFGFTILVITGQRALAEAADRIYEVADDGDMPVLRLKAYDSVGKDEPDLPQIA